MWLAVAMLSVAGLAALLAPADAGATRGITTGIAVPESKSADAAVRRLWLDRTVEANADLIRIDVIWREVVGSQPPASPGDPADPAYDFSGVDAAVREAQQRGLKMLFTVFAAPEWAEGPGRPEGVPAGAWKPDADAFGEFGAALARRYSGNFSPAAGLPPLPRVRYFEAWNEPNLPDFFLAPGWVGDRAEGVAIYRELLNSFYDRVKAVNPGNLVVGPGTAPFGSDMSQQSRIRPVAFLRELFCLKGRAKLAPQPCPPVKLDVFSHHALSSPHPATYNAIDPDDAASSDLDRLVRVLEAADNAGVLRPRGKRPIWVTEFWWVSDPPGANVLTVPERVHARNIEEALYVYWKQRVSVAIQYLIRDPGGLSPFQTGLSFEDGTPKLAFQAFRFPFVTERLSRKRIRAWGRSPKAGKVKIQSRKRGGWRTVKRLRVREDGVFTARLQGSKKMRAQIQGEKSLVWRR
jgi:hypothetical protein